MTHVHQTAPKYLHAPKDLVEWGEKADASNLERGFLLFAFKLSSYY